MESKSPIAYDRERGQTVEQIQRIGRKWLLRYVGLGYHVVVPLPLLLTTIAAVVLTFSITVAGRSAGRAVGRAVGRAITLFVDFDELVCVAVVFGMPRASMSISFAVLFLVVTVAAVTAAVTVAIAVAEIAFSMRREQFVRKLSHQPLVEGVEVFEVVETEQLVSALIPFALNRLKGVGLERTQSLTANHEHVGIRFFVEGREHLKRPLEIGFLKWR